MSNLSPLVIGGMGGSGTRVYRLISILAGYNMNSCPNFLRPLFGAEKSSEMHDNYLLLKYFYDKWVDSYRHGDLSSYQKKLMQWQLRASLWFCELEKSEKWGWKNPRTIYLIDFFANMYPNMRFIHVIRDGRDHAFHPSFSYNPHKSFLLAPEEINLPDHQRKALSWSRTHELAEKMAEKHLPGRYLQAKLEDLCKDPLNESKRILNFLGVSNPELEKAAASIVKTPSSLGRWKNEPSDRVAEVDRVVGKELTRWGYPLSVAST